MNDTVVGFSGRRVGPTVKDIEIMEEKLENLLKRVKEGKIGGIAYSYVSDDVEGMVGFDWLRMPGASTHELLASVQFLLTDITTSSMQSTHNPNNTD